MTLSKNEIIDLARRYVTEEEMGDFPLQGDLFCFIERPFSTGVTPEKEHEGWVFGGYALCTGYEYDAGSKPEGKWLLFNFLSLQTFPPTPESLKLQPPHIVKGTFSNSDRTREIRVLRIANALFNQAQLLEPKQIKGVSRKKRTQSVPDNVIQFPGKKR